MNDSIATGRTGSSDSSSISSTLLGQVKAGRPEAWARLVELYGPVVYRWCRRAGVGREDAADVVQEVFCSVAARVADFRRSEPGDSFSAWIGTITRNKIRDWFRRHRGRAEARGGTDAYEHLREIPDLDEPSQTAVRVDDGGLLSRRAMELVRAEFEDRTWEAFWRVTVDGQYPADVAEDLDMSVNAVYKAKFRVLRRLRQELDGLQ